MEENNFTLMDDEISHEAVETEAVMEFDQNNSTAIVYNKLIEENYTTNCAVKEVCRKFDVFCSHTSNVSYLMERYTELYNHSMITKPMATSLVALMISLVVNIGFSVFESGIPNDTEFWLATIIASLFKYIITISLIVYALKTIFKEIKHTYSPYDVFVLSYERERIYKELINRGYTVPRIKE